MRLKVGAQTATREFTLRVGAASGFDHFAGVGATNATVGETTLGPDTADRVSFGLRLDAVHAVADGVAYSGQQLAGSNANGIVARDIDSGQLLWQRELRGPDGNTAACEEIAVTSQLLLCRLQGRIDAVRRTGAHDVVWSTGTADPGTQLVSIQVDGGRVFALQSDSLRAYRVSDGEFLTSRSLSSDGTPAFAVGGGRVVVLLSSGQTRTLRSFTANDSLTVGWQATPQGATSLAVSAERVITLERVDGVSRLVLRKLSDGTPAGGYTSEIPSFGGVYADATRAYFATSSFGEWGYDGGGAVTAVNLSDGTLAWRSEELGPMYSGLTSANGVVWVHQSDLIRYAETSRLYALSATDGRTIAHKVVKAASSQAPRVAGGRVFLYTAVYVGREGHGLPPIQVWGLSAGALTVEPQLLPSGLVGTPYEAALTGAKGNGAVRWSTTDPLPAGLSLSTSGSITGTPTTAGTRSVTVTATDEAGRSVGVRVRIAVDQPTAPNSWPSVFGGSSRNSSAAGHPGFAADALGSFANRWSTTTQEGGYYRAYPIAVDGALFVVNNVGALARYATAGSGADKAPTWSTKATNPATPASPVDLIGTPTLSGTPSAGTILTYAGDRSLVAFSAATGTQLWRAPDVGYADDGTFAPLVAGDTVVILDRATARITARSVATGAERWSRTFDSGRNNTDKLSSDGTRVFAIDDRACSLRAFSLANGADVWTTSLKRGATCALYGAMATGPVVSEGVVFATDDYSVIAADAATGTVRWRAEANGYANSLVVNSRWVVLRGIPWGGGDFTPGTVLDRETGEVLRSFSADLNATGSGGHPTLIGDLLIGSKDNRIVAYDLVANEQVWQSSALTNLGVGGTLLSGARIFVTTGDGRVVGFGPAGP